MLTFLILIHVVPWLRFCNLNLILISCEKTMTVFGSWVSSPVLVHQQSSAIAEVPARDEHEYPDASFAHGVPATTTMWTAQRVVLGGWDQLLLPFLEKEGNYLSRIDVAAPSRRSERKTRVVAKWEDRCFACLRWRPTMSQLRRNRDLRFRHVHIFVALQVRNTPQCQVDVRRKMRPWWMLQSVPNRSLPIWHKESSQWQRCQVSNPQLESSQHDHIKTIRLPAVTWYVHFHIHIIWYLI